MKKIFLGLFALTILVIACKHEPSVPAPVTVKGGANIPVNNTPPEVPCDSTKVYFDREIQPILNRNCAVSGCHDAGTATDGVILNDYNNTVQTADVRPFDPESSDLYERVTETDPDKMMPPPSKPGLTSDEINLIAKWINQGGLRPEMRRRFV